MTKLLGAYCYLADTFKNCFYSRTSAQTILPLSSLCRTGKIRICKVSGDRKLCARMAAMGLYTGIEAELLCPVKGSQCVIKIHGGSICLDREISKHILVSQS